MLDHVLPELTGCPDDAHLVNLAHNFLSDDVVLLRLLNNAPASVIQFNKCLVIVLAAPLYRELVM
jgi:hypothetical protein